MVGISKRGDPRVTSSGDGGNGDDDGNLGAPNKNVAKGLTSTVVPPKKPFQTDCLSTI
jgi:hypothetical protein